MNFIKSALLLIGVITLTSCASGYRTINPNTVNYISSDVNENIKLEYKYDLLPKKYQKKETKKGIKVVAIKITNNSENDIMFGKDIIVTYENGNEIVPMENTTVFKSLKQNSASYLLYLLLTPLQLTKTESTTRGIKSSSTPIGVVIGPGIALGNMIVAGSANTKFKTELLNYDINGTLIKKGETKFGLIGIRSNSFDALNLKIK